MDFTIPLSVLILYVIWHVGWRRLMLDSYRMELFRLRDQLFDAAREGKLSFEGASYQCIRASLNARLRYAHRMTLTDLLTLRFFVPSYGNAAQKVAKLVDTAIEQAETDQGRRVIATIERCAAEASALHFVAITPLVWPIAFYIIAASAAGSLARRLRLLSRKLTQFSPIAALMEYPLVEERAERAQVILERGQVLQHVRAMA